MVLNIKLSALEHILYFLFQWNTTVLDDHFPVAAANVYHSRMSATVCKIVGMA